MVWPPSPPNLLEEYADRTARDQGTRRTVEGLSHRRPWFVECRDAVVDRHSRAPRSRRRVPRRGALKVGDPDASVRAVQAYRLLPTDVAEVVGYVLPAVEIGLGLLLLLGLMTRVAAAAALILLVAFVIGVSSAWARGLSIDCGCFGGGGEVAPGATRYVEELIRDAGLIIAAGVPHPPTADPVRAGPIRRSPRGADTRGGRRVKAASGRRETKRENRANARAARCRAGGAAPARAHDPGGCRGSGLCSSFSRSCCSWRRARATRRPTMPRCQRVSTPLVAGCPSARPKHRSSSCTRTSRCPICKTFEDALGSTLADLVSAGTARIVYYPLSFLDRQLGNDSSLRAANAAGCAQDAGAFAAYHDTVFTNQPASAGTAIPTRSCCSSVGMPGSRGCLRDVRDLRGTARTRAGCSRSSRLRTTGR